MGPIRQLQAFVCAQTFWPQFMIRWFQAEKGPFTIFFYCPLAKWGISIANINDMIKKPVETVNPVQQSVITLTGTLIARWCWVLSPRQYMLVVCNSVMACTGIIQLWRKHQAGLLF
ncbi:unnamed protein product (macronuclear) [Paramecium tetraurelia]|uniref:Mitochondrial pyruvate carrier n=2 Tax=Paramecium TaxID=5884 RepID=A0CPV9_PARTE|nr:uncharacterized protein GSPATT00009218001 [Paramecium tetraurelia]CAD8136114.1 unnamed protein product [Paramecium octaurelia]CAK72826.1 unnamed protein product [Paramecium tetraurelia]|eukprot:XP_001440223.1 hypothetical protein (macronuclear) [Paramecium tetraurelia strain d4-2]